VVVGPDERLVPGVRALVRILVVVARVVDVRVKVGDQVQVEPEAGLRLQPGGPLQFRYRVAVRPGTAGEDDEIAHGRKR
jgi:hypothetical protein